MGKINEETRKAIDLLNQKLEEYGMFKIDLVSPYDCIPQKKNARYFEAEKFQQLVTNIRQEGALESVPLVMPADKDGKYKIISGHHRIDASKEADLELIMVMICTPEDQDDIVMKQLAHNALSGKDDEVILYELFQSIDDISKRMATGLSDEMDSIAYTSLNFRVGSFKQFTVMFLPEDIGVFDETLDLIDREATISGDEEVRLTSIEIFDDFAQAIRKIKKAENIKNNGVALMRMVELAQEMIQHHGEEK